MARPRLLLLDEPSLGLAPLIIKHIFEAIKELNKITGLTVFLVEQNAFGALKLADRGYVMVNGIVTMSGIERGSSCQSGSARGLSRRRSSLSRSESASGFRTRSCESRIRARFLRSGVGSVAEENAPWRLPCKAFYTKNLHSAVPPGYLPHGRVGCVDDRPGLRQDMATISRSSCSTCCCSGLLSGSSTLLCLVARCSRFTTISSIRSVLIIIGTLGYRYTRTKQMVRQYHWLYEKVSPLTWSKKKAWSRKARYLAIASPTIAGTGAR